MLAANCYIKEAAELSRYFDLSCVVQGRTESIDCRYLVAADGANSRLRRMLGVPLRGKSDMQHLVNIHFIAPGLQSSLRGREAMLYFVFNSNVIAVLVAHDISKGEFVAQASALTFTLRYVLLCSVVCVRARLHRHTMCCASHSALMS